MPDEDRQQPVVMSDKQLLADHEVCRRLGISREAFEWIRNDPSMRFPRPLQIWSFPVWTVEQVERYVAERWDPDAAAAACRGEDFMRFKRAIEMHEWACGVLKTPGVSETESFAASYCVQMFAELLNERDKVRRLNADREKLRQRSRAGFLRRAKELPPEAIPPSLREFAGRLIDYPVPCAGHPLIYFLLDGDEIVYVGQSVSIETRLAQHALSRKKFDRVLVMPVSDAELDETEKDLIGRLCPKLNTTHVPAEVLRARCAAPGGAEGGV
jgi:predicted DNA-binding transcriptional regulator AlpA